MSARKIRLAIWAILLPIVAWYTYQYYTDEKLRESNAPGRFSIMVLGFVLVVVIGSVVEWLTTRKR